jgi:hypothetical protein
MSITITVGTQNAANTEIALEQSLRARFHSLGYDRCYCLELAGLGEMKINYR